MLEILARLVLSTFLGAVIGLERELRDIPAGMRTHALVALGSTIFTVAALTVFYPGADSTRIVAQIAVGIGFIAGGIIFKTGAGVFGLTTAANMWVTAALGIMVGMGNYVFSVAATVLVVLVLVSDRFLDRYIPRYKRRKK